MAPIWQGIWYVCTLLLLVSCSKQPVQAPLAPNTQVLDQVYQQGRVAFKERRYDDAVVTLKQAAASATVGTVERKRIDLNTALVCAISGKLEEARKTLEASLGPLARAKRIVAAGEALLSARPADAAVARQGRQHDHRRCRSGHHSGKPDHQLPHYSGCRFRSE